MFEKIKENKALKLIWNILYTLLFFIVLLILVVVVLQRVSNNTIAIGGVRIFSVLTGSMEPHYKVGDVLVSKEVDVETLKVGDDIVYLGKKGSFNNKFITHRIISIEKLEDGNFKIITQGTANEEQDPEIDQTQVYGKIIYKVQILSFLSKLVQNIYKLYFLIFVPIALLLFRQIKMIMNSRASNDDEEDDDEENDNKTE